MGEAGVVDARAGATVTGRHGPTVDPAHRRPSPASTSGRATARGDRPRCRSDPTDRLRRDPRPDSAASPRPRPVGVLLTVLCVVGLVMVGSASPIISLITYGSPWTHLLSARSCGWASGSAPCSIFARVDYRKWRSGPVAAPGRSTLGLLVAVLVPGLGVTAGGSARWIGFGQLRLQPSELMKLALVVFAADLLARRADRRRAGQAGDRAGPGRARASRRVLIMKQPDMGTASVLAASPSGSCSWAACRWARSPRSSAASSLVAVVFALADPYRRDRILSFINPGAHQSGSGYQVWQSLIGLGSGHLFGLGLGGGREKWGSLPNAHTDFIFSVVGEELGLVGAVVMLGLFFALAWYGLPGGGAGPGPLRQPAGRRRHHAGSPVRPSSTSGRSSACCPVTGIPLPFISFGGSSLVITLAAVGILMNIAAAGASAARRPAAATPRPGVTSASVTDGARPTGFALVAGGGTAGHLQPALAIAEALVARGHARATIEFVGLEPRPGRAGARRAGVPADPAPRPGDRAAASAPRDLARNARCGLELVLAAAASAPWPRSGTRPRVVVAVGRLRQPGRRGGGRGPPGPPGAGERRRRPRCGQPAVRAVRPGQRGGLGGNAPAAVGGDRHAGAARDRRRRPRARGPRGRPGATSGCPPTGPSWSPSAARSGPGGSTEAVGRWPRRWSEQRDDLSIYHVVGRRDWDAHVEPTAERHRAARRGRPAGLVLAGCPTRSGWTCRLRGRRRGGVPGRGHDRGRAGRRPGCPPSSCPCPAPRATTRPPTPGCSSGPAPPCCSPIRTATPAALATAARRACWPTPTGSTPWDGRPRPWRGPTPPTPGPRWSRPVPGPTAGAGRR